MVAQMRTRHTRSVVNCSNRQAMDTRAQHEAPVPAMKTPRLKRSTMGRSA